MTAPMLNDLLERLENLRQTEIGLVPDPDHPGGYTPLMGFSIDLTKDERLALIAALFREIRS